MTKLPLKKLNRYRYVMIALLGASIMILIAIIDYNHTSSDTDILPNYNRISIEHALQDIPQCTPNDTIRQRALLHILQQWIQFARNHHLRYWIAYETLLAYARFQHLAPYDHKIDLHIMAQDTSQLVRIAQQNMSTIYELRIHPQWFHPTPARRSYFHSEGIDFIGPNARFIDRQNNVHIDIWPMYDYHPNQTRMNKTNELMLFQYGDVEPNRWKPSPREWTFPLRSCQFSRMTLSCPAQPHKLLINIYGDMYLNVSKRECLNNSWVKLYEERSTTLQGVSTVETTSVKTLSDEEFIEEALKDIPICTSGDRARQRLLLRNILTWSRFAEEHHFGYSIAYGTLVGYVQRRGLLPHDADVDVSLMYKDTAELEKWSKVNFSSTYELKVQPQWLIPEIERRWYFRKNVVHFVAPNARFIHRVSGYHVDIFPEYDFNPLYSNTSTDGSRSENLTIYGMYYRWFSYPRSWTYPLQTCYFSGIKVLCPAQPEKLVVSLFGHNSLTKSDTKCVDRQWTSVL